MPAVFFTLSKQDIFKSGGSASSLVTIPSVDAIVEESGLALYDSVSMQLGETIQYFLTFDDVIKFIHFGKALGSVQVEGTMFCDCEGDLPGIPKFAEAFRKLRGEKVKVVIGGIVLESVMTSASVTVIADSDTMAHFTFTFSVVSHQL